MLEGLFLSINKRSIPVLFLSIILYFMLFPSSVSLIAQSSLTSAKSGRAFYDSRTNIITITCNTNLSQINQIINNRMVLEKDPNGIWILKSSIKVNPLAKITIKSK